MHFSRSVHGLPDISGSWTLWKIAENGKRRRVSQMEHVTQAEDASLPGNAMKSTSLYLWSIRLLEIITLIVIIWLSALRELTVIIQSWSRKVRRLPK